MKYPIVTSGLNPDKAEMHTGPAVSERILYEDNHLIIVNKLPSEIVQGDKTGDIPLSEQVKEYIADKYHKPGKVFLGLVHRIDRPVSGAVIFARTSKALARMNAMLQSRELKKAYWAVVKNNPPQPEGILKHTLRKNEKLNKSFVVDKGSPVGKDKDAELRYKVAAKSDEYCLLEVELITGRHHQVRAQLSAIGCFIKGDLKYGFSRSNNNASIHLHARTVSFAHPVTGNPVSITAPVPEDKLWKYFETVITRTAISP